MSDCPMCGKPAKHLLGRWYQYDNGQQELVFVCKTCVEGHSQSATGKIVEKQEEMC